MNAATTVDTLIIGAGAGGLCAAARLVAAGRSVLVVEALGRVGGRASSEVIDGFTVNVGAIAIERGGVFEETFGLLGLELDIREPNPATVFRIDGKLINVAKGGWGMLLGTFTKQAAQDRRQVRRRTRWRPARGQAQHAGLADAVHQQRDRARDLPQPVRGDLRGQCRRAAGAGLLDLLRDEGRLQALRLLPAWHGGLVERPDRCDPPARAAMCG
jgi:phytoene dehydrogenase-like protein